MQKKLTLSILSAILLALPWLGLGGWSLFVAFVPLLILQSRNTHRFGLWATLTFILWIAMSAWWVSISTMIAAFAIPLVGLFFSLTPFMIYHYVWRRQPGHLAWVVFVTAWIAFEALYTYQDISFPWLNLGNGFADMPWSVQWYEYTGTFGGSLWVLVSNVLFFNLWQQRRSIKRIVAVCVWILVPLTVSLIQYVSYEESEKPLEVCVVQPNFDPYVDKFGELTEEQQVGVIMGLSSESDANVDFIIMPETSIGNFAHLWESRFAASPSIVRMGNFLRTERPKATIVTGAMTFGEVGSRAVPYNSALWIDSSLSIDVYHKSKLVCGAEFTPYPEVFDFMKIDLGGISGNFGRQAYRDVFRRVGVAICYESIYGAYVTEYVDRGAEALFIITNDGWWGDTRGYQHHLNYARLRAIETRRSIARSANTGISAIINQRGDVVQQLDWDTRGVINATINLNDKVTMYTVYKDIIVRLAIYVLGLSLLFFVGQRFRKKR